MCTTLHTPDLLGTRQRCSPDILIYFFPSSESKADMESKKKPICVSVFQCVH